FYFIPSSFSGNRFKANGTQLPGLSLQLIQRLKELRDLVIALAIIESSVVCDGFRFPPPHVIRELELNLPFHAELVETLYGLNMSEKKKIVKLLNTDRESSLNLASFLEMMLNLFQETDSTIDDSVLAFYEQREWRLIHHMRAGLKWH